MLSRSGRPIIDMRSRPAFLHKFFGSTPATPEYEIVRWLNKRVGSRDVDHFSRARDAKGFVEEMDSAGISVAVMVARSVPGVRISNDDLAKVMATAPNRLFGVASVDPVELGTANAVAEATRAIKVLGHKGINIDAGFYAEPVKANDDGLMPIYEVCQALGVPAFIMSGPTTPNLNYNDPFAVDVVAKTFPKLKIVCCHGFYPRIADVITVAFRNENVFISPDMYTFAPGGQLYVEAANGFMKDQFFFGSSYPFRPMKQGVEDFQALGLSDDAYEAATYKNAQSLFGIKLDA